MGTHLGHAAIGTEGSLRPRYFLVLIVWTAALTYGSAAAAQTLEMVTVSSSGEQANDQSFGFLSSEGGLICFASSATNLVPEDTNDVIDSFVRIRRTGVIMRISVSPSGEQANGTSGGGRMAANGRYVAFESYADNLVPGDMGWGGIFVHDMDTGEIERVSESSLGEQADGPSYWPSISADGRYVAFGSNANNLVADDTNVWPDIFVHDRLLGLTTRVNVSSLGEQGDSETDVGQISADGRYVAFASAASNLVSDDTNFLYDVFVHDRLTAETHRVSVSSKGAQSNGPSHSASISSDGRYVTFFSDGTNLVAGDSNNLGDIFVHDCVINHTSRLNLSSTGEQADGGTNPMSTVAANGQFVAFSSGATNLVPNDTNGVADIFVHDQFSGKTVRINLSCTGEEANGHSSLGSISADGRHVAFLSAASNLVPGDTNEAEDVFVVDRAVNAIPGDINGDGGVNITDLLAVLSGWGRCTETLACCPEDTDHNGQINVSDLLIVIANWG